MRGQIIFVQVAKRLEAPQICSTRALYKAKWTHFVQWCQTSEVDFSSPSIHQIADFLMYLIQERNLQPGKLDSFKIAIADMVEKSSLNISKDENLTRQRERPKGTEAFTTETCP